VVKTISISVTRRLPGPACHAAGVECSIPACDSPL
jgi:hypothetical protein